MKKDVYQIVDICEIKSGKRLPKDTDFSDYETDYPYIRARDIKDGKINTDALVYLEKHVQEKIKRYIINSGDIAITIVGASVGDVGYASKNVDGYNLTENAVRLTSFAENVNSRYLFYILYQKQYRDYMQLIAGAAAQPKLGIYKVQRIKVELPNIETQNKIADILSTYDALIENNNKRIAILEQMAENLYKEWFIRFRFPGYENAKFENGIPKDWGCVKLDKVLTVLYGKDHSKLEDGDVPVYGSGGIMRYGNRALYNGESVLIPRKGSLNNIMWVNPPFWTVDTMFYTKAKIPHVEKYIYYVLSSLDMASYNTGAALPSMTTDILYHLKIVLPSASLLEKFDAIVSDLYAQRTLLENKNQNLIKQRDLLLPRLMSGKLEV